MLQAESVLNAQLPPNYLAHLAPQPPQDDVSELVFKISRDSEARVAFSGDVTQEAIEKLIKLLDVSKDTYPTQEELARERRHEVEMAELAGETNSEEE